LQRRKKKERLIPNDLFLRADFSSGKQNRALARTMPEKIRKFEWLEKKGRRAQYGKPHESL
jgi:hypothetical protein